MNMDEILKTFIAESEELLQQMEAALLQIEQAPDDVELINAIFRAAHTIKGSAGLFGLDHVVAFTHVAESVLDRIRSNELAFDETLSALFLEVCDHLNGLIARVSSGSEPEPDFQAAGAVLVQRLEHYLQPSAKRPSRSLPPVPWRHRSMAWPPATGTCRCASVRTCCATAWIPCRSCATSTSSARSRASPRCPTTCPRWRTGRGVLLSRLRDRAAQQRQQGRHRRRFRVRAR